MRHHLAIITALFTFVFALHTVNAQENRKGPRNR